MFQPSHRTQEQIDRARSMKRDGPVYLLNLLKLKPSVTLPDGRQMSGKDSYRIYKEHCAPILLAQGARPLIFGRFECTMAGVDEDWDQVFVMGYPSVDAVNGMATNADYQAIAFYRAEAVERMRLIRLEPSVMSTPVSAPESAMQAWVENN